MTEFKKEIQDVFKNNCNFIQLLLGKNDIIMQLLDMLSDNCKIQKRKRKTQRTKRTKKQIKDNPKKLLDVYIESLQVEMKIDNIKLTKMLNNFQIHIQS